MTRDRSVEARISEWLLEEAPGELPDRVLRATFERTRASRQRRSILGWRSLRMIRLSPTTVAVGAAAIAVLAIGALLLPRSNPSIGVAPSPSVSPSSSPTVSPAPSGPGSTFGIAFDAPQSWTVSHDSAYWFYLATPSGNETLQGLFLFRDPILPVVDPVCSEIADPSRPHALNDFVDFLANDPGLVTSDPVPVTIGGRSGFSIDVALEPAGANQDTCVTFLIEGSTPLEYVWSASFGENQRVAFLDGGEGHVIAVVINARGGIKFNLVTQDIAPILDSLSFLDRP